ncbi:MAG: hypothetical protein ACYTA5_19225 [Planctomycetota bacterium]|jgi:hypothetical protein
MHKSKCCFALPKKLCTDFDKECAKSGYVREKVIAAAMLKFLDSDPNTRSKMFERLAKFSGGK